MSTDTQPRFSVKRTKSTPKTSSKPASGARVTITGAPELPQVNLLPASVRAGRALQRTKVYLLLVVGVVVIAAILGYVASMLAVSSAQSELEIVQAETTRLQQKQSTFSEVPQVKGQIADTEAARSVGMASEVAWSSYVSEILLQMPPGSVVTSIVTTAMSPLDPAPVPADPLVPGGVASVAISHRSPTLPDTAAWLDVLNGIGGLHDAQVSTQAISEEDGVVYYEVTTTVQVGADALTGRFGPEGESE